MISTPRNPTSTAVQRRQPTCSPSSGTESAVMNIGAAKPIATTSASGSSAKASKKQTSEVNPTTARNACSRG